MRHAIIYTTDADFSQFLEIAKKIKYIKKIELDQDKAKKEILENIEEGFKEMTLFKQGIKEGTQLNDFLNEL